MTPLFSPYIKVKCRDGPRFILKKPETAFTIAFPEWDVKVKSLIDFYNSIEVTATPEVHKKTKSIVEKLTENYAALQAHYQAAYLGWWGNPCSKKAEKEYNDAKAIICQKEFTLNQLELTTRALYEQSKKGYSASINDIISIEELVSNLEVVDIISELTSKVVLILGSFTPERKSVLNAIKEKLEGLGYKPVMLDVVKPTNRDKMETVSTIAHLSKFIIADISEPRSVPLELDHIVTQLPSVPVKPIIQSSEREYGMFKDLLRYPWVLDVYRYVDKDQLILDFQKNVIGPAEAKVKELQKNKK